MEEFRLRKSGSEQPATSVVTPRAYITDNRVTLDAIACLGANARGVAMIHPTVTDADLTRDISPQYA